MRYIITLLLTSAPALAEVPRVVTDIPPVYFPAQPQFSNYLTVWASSVNPASALLSTTVIAVGVSSANRS